MKTFIPLSGVRVTGKLLEGFGKFTVHQEYINILDQNLECTYIFPLDKSATIVDFQFQINDRVIKAVLKSKQQAREDYHQAVKVENKTAFILEQDYTGLYKIQLGNIPAKSTVTVSFTYLMVCPLTDDGFKLVFPTNIAPKYYHSDNSNNFSTSIGYVAPSPNIFKFKIDIEVESKAEIESIESISHSLFLKPWEKSYAKSHHVEITLDPLEGDFNMFVKTNISHYPLVYRQVDNTDTYIMLYHQIGKEESEDNSPFTEYVFFLDRSGSMIGQKMHDAINALKISIRALPSNSKFNIVGFGSRFETMWNDSTPYTTKSVEEFLEKADKMGADLGGTDIYSPLQHYLQNKVIQEVNHKRVFILLTDGQVSNENQIIDLIKGKSLSDRIFTIGIGNDASRTLLEKMACSGHGLCEMIVDSKDIGKTIVKLLSLSSKQYYHDVSVNINDVTTPMIWNTSTIYPNVPFFMFAKVDSEKVGDITITARDSNDHKKTWTLPIGPMDEVKLDQLYAKFMIDDLNNGTLSIDKVIELSTELSFKHNVACRYTSFYGEDTVVLENRDMVVMNVPHINTICGQGPQGPQGAQGAQGPMGSPGPTGPSGPRDRGARDFHDSCRVMPKTLPITKTTFRQTTENFNYVGRNKLGAGRLKAYDPTDIAKTTFRQTTENFNYVGTFRQTTEDYYGINTIGQSLKNPNIQLRSDPVIPKSDISPFRVQSDYTSVEVNDLVKAFLEKGPEGVRKGHVRVIGKNHKVDDLLKYQNLDNGSFMTCDDIYTMIEVTPDQVKSFSIKNNLDIHLGLQFFIFHYLCENNNGHDLIIQKLLKYINQMK